MNLIADELSSDNNLMSLLTKIHNKVCDYFNSNETNEKSRSEIYESNVVTDEDGMAIGTIMPSLKGKNVSECSEKSLAAYIILKKNIFK